MGAVGLAVLRLGIVNTVMANWSQTIRLSGDRLLLGAMVLVVCAMTPACASARKPVFPKLDAPLQWPAAPARARVRYIGALSSSADVAQREGMSVWFDRMLHGPTPQSAMVTPYAVAVHDDGRRVAVADTQAQCVHVFDLAARTYDKRFRIGDGTHERLRAPVGVAWLGDTLWVADAQLPGLVQLAEGDRAGRVVGGDLLRRPAGLAACGSRGLLVVSDAGTHSLLIFDREGQLVRVLGRRGAGEGELNFPAQVDCRDGSIVVADALNFRIQRFSLDGELRVVFGRQGDAAGDLALPKGVALDDSGQVWVVDARFENVQAFDEQGRLLMAFGEEGAAPGQFWLPAGACVDQQQRLWVADSYNRRVQVFELLP